MENHFEAIKLTKETAEEVLNKIGFNIPVGEDEKYGFISEEGIEFGFCGKGCIQPRFDSHTYLIKDGDDWVFCWDEESIKNCFFDFLKSN